MNHKLFIAFAFAIFWISGINAHAQNKYDPQPQKPKSSSTPCYSTDIIHMDLSIGAIDWVNQSITAQEVLYIKATEPISTLVVDSKGKKVLSDVYFTGEAGPGLEYTQDSAQVTVQLGREIPPGETFSILFVYTAWPRGSANITGGDAGLNFINPLGTIPGKPRQLWAQGEPENNSKWFLTHDRLECDDKFSATISVVIPQNMVSLSNGILTSTTNYASGNKQDTWKFDQDQSSYLYTLVVGDYAVVEDSWNGKPVQYYVEKAYEPYARDIFGETPQMLTFFSNRLGVQYPWAKYAQVVLRDYPSGAMENTTATTFFERMHGTKRERDAFFNAEVVVPHEMMHHWFGDYVTPTDWAALTLSEGFATLGEDWWLRHKLGDGSADFYRRRALQNYFAQCARGDAHPLIDYDRSDKDVELMFDAHSYTKGGAVLFMLQHIMGEEAFLRALKTYLQSHAYGSVSVDDFQTACERAARRGLDDFFTQWFYKTGHPVLDVTCTLKKKHATVTIKQLQPWGLFAIDDLPIKIYYKDGRTEDGFISVDRKKKRTRTFYTGRNVDYIVFDPNRTFLVDWRFHYTAAEYEKIAFVSKDYVSALEACDSLITYKAENPNWAAISDKMIDHVDWRFQYRGINNSPWRLAIGSDFERTCVGFVKDTAVHYMVRKAALAKLQGDTYYELFYRTALYDPSLEIQASALTKLYAVDSTRARELGESEWYNIELNGGLHQRYLTNSVATIFANTGYTLYTDYFRHACKNGNIWVREEIKKPLIVWLRKIPAADRGTFIEYLRLFDGEYADVISELGPKK